LLGLVSMSTNEVQVATRVSQALFKKILFVQSEAKRRTGIEPSISSVVRALIEKAAGK
jgi:hypothetical protein